MFIVVLSDVFRMICLCFYFCGVFSRVFYVCVICVAFCLRVLSVFPHVNEDDERARLDKSKLKVQRHFTSPQVFNKMPCGKFQEFGSSRMNTYQMNLHGIKTSGLGWFRHFMEKSSLGVHFIKPSLINCLEKHAWCNLGGTTDLTQRSVREPWWNLPRNFWQPKTDLPQTKESPKQFCPETFTMP